MNVRIICQRCRDKGVLDGEGSLNHPRIVEASGLVAFSANSRTTKSSEARMSGARSTPNIEENAMHMVAKMIMVSAQKVSLPVPLGSSSYLMSQIQLFEVSSGFNNGQALTNRLISRSKSNIVHGPFMPW